MFLWHSISVRYLTANVQREKSMKGDILSHFERISLLIKPVNKFFSPLESMIFINEKMIEFIKCLCLPWSTLYVFTHHYQLGKKIQVHFIHSPWNSNYWYKNKPLWDTWWCHVLWLINRGTVLSSDWRLSKLLLRPTMLMTSSLKLWNVSRWAVHGRHFSL